MQFPVFVRSRKEANAPTRPKEKSLLEAFREQTVGGLTSVQMAPRESVETRSTRVTLPCAATPPVARAKQKDVGFVTAFDNAVENISCEGLSAIRAAQSVTCTGTSDVLLLRTEDAAPDVSLRPIARTVFRNSPVLLPIQQAFLHTLVSGAASCVISGPFGCGKRTGVLFAAAVVAESTKRWLKGKGASVGPLAVVVTSSNEEMRWARNVLMDSFRQRVSVVTEARMLEGSWCVDGDVWITTGLQLASLLSKSVDGNADDVRFLAVFGAERWIAKPLADKMDSNAWGAFRAMCHPEAVTAVVGCMPTRTLAAADVILHLDSQPTATITQLDATAWQDVVHEVCYVEQDLVKEYCKEVVEQSSELSVIVTSSRAEVESMSSWLLQEGIDSTADTRLFAEGQTKVLVVSDYLLGELFTVPATVRLVVNIGVPRRDPEEALTFRRRLLLVAKSLDHVVQMLTIVNHDICPTWLAAKLKRFLECTGQAVPPVLEQLRVREDNE